MVKCQYMSVCCVHVWRSKSSSIHWLYWTGWLAREPEGGVFLLRGELSVPPLVLYRSTVTDVNATIPGFTWMLGI